MKFGILVFTLLLIGSFTNAIELGTGVGNGGHVIEKPNGEIILAEIATLETPPVKLPPDEKLYDVFGNNKGLLKEVQRLEDLVRSRLPKNWLEKAIYTSWSDIKFYRMKDLSCKIAGPKKSLQTFCAYRSVKSESKNGLNNEFLYTSIVEIKEDGRFERMTIEQKALALFHEGLHYKMLVARGNYEIIYPIVSGLYILDKIQKKQKPLNKMTIEQLQEPKALEAFKITADDYERLVKFQNEIFPIYQRRKGYRTNYTTHNLKTAVERNGGGLIYDNYNGGDYLDIIGNFKRAVQTINQKESENFISANSGVRIGDMLVASTEKYEIPFYNDKDYYRTGSIKGLRIINSNIGFFPDKKVLNTVIAHSSIDDYVASGSSNHLINSNIDLLQIDGHLNFLENVELRTLNIFGSNNRMRNVQQVKEGTIALEDSSDSEVYDVRISDKLKVEGKARVFSSSINYLASDADTFIENFESDQKTYLHAGPGKSRIEGFSIKNTQFLGVSVSLDENTSIENTEIRTIEDHARKESPYFSANPILISFTPLSASEFTIKNLKWEIHREEFFNKWTWNIPFENSIFNFENSKKIKTVLNNCTDNDGVLPFDRCSSGFNHENKTEIDSIRNEDDFIDFFDKAFESI